MFDPLELKICFLAGTLGRGGAERQLVYMLRALKSKGIQTRVLCLTKGESFESEIEALGVSVEYMSSMNGSRPRKLAQIIRSLRREPADIIQSVHFYTNLYAAVAGRLVGIKEIGAIRSNLFSELAANGAIGRLHFRSPRHLIANSALARERAVNAGIKPNKIDLLPNVVAIEGNNGNASSKKNGTRPRLNGAVRILFVGRLTEEKRADRFLRVIANVKREVPHLVLKAVIAGEGPLRPGLQSMAAKLGLDESSVEFLGERKDMDAVYEGADLLMLTSDWEGTPNALLEAMAHGLPVAATRVGGVPEIVGQDRGLLADPDDEEEMTRVAVHLVSDASLRNRFGQSGRDYVARNHSIELLPDNLTGIYRKVLTG